MGSVTPDCIRPFLLAAMLWLPGCTAMTAVSAVPGTLIGVVANQFTGKEQSFPVSMQTTLAATQQSLRQMQLDADVLEIQKEDGYGIAFSNPKLDGTITLRKQTPLLTTVYVEVRSFTREESVEQAIIEMIGTTVRKISRNSRFDSNGYNNLRAEPTIASAKVGWFRPGASLEVSSSGTPNWLKIKLPSGKKAYLKGTINNGKQANNGR